jgi:alpha-L-arabinofuranosidase
MFALLLLDGAVGAADFWVAPTGSDIAPGSRTEPFKTIQHAADTMQAGDVCHVRAGTYREWVQPPRGGDSESRRIIYRAEAGEQVVIKGSERITSWARNTNGPWQVRIPDSFFGTFNPCKQTLSGGWLSYGKDYHLGMVYLDGRPLRELLQESEVARTPSTFRFESVTGATVIHANFGAANPNAQLAEINVRECIFFPRVKGLRFITVDGFTMKHAAANWACFRAFQHAALGTYWGKNWVIQNCSISDARCAAIVCGNDPSHEDEGFDVESVGHHIVRRNHIQRCGQAGICGFKGWADSVIEHNLIEDINEGNQFGGYETGGIKLHDAVDVVIRGNVVRRVTGGNGQFAGIWLDWGAQGTRVTSNVVYDMNAMALFLQNTHGGPILVDNNILSGPVCSTAAGVVFAHNLFDGCEHSSAVEDFRGVYLRPHSATVAAVEPFVREHNRYLNNYFVRRGLDTISEAPGFESDWNVFCERAKKNSWGDTASWVQGDGDGGVRLTSLPGGVELEFRANAAARDLKCPMVTGESVGRFPRTGQGLDYFDGRPMDVDCDVRGQPRGGTNTAAGPLAALSVGVNRIRLVAGPKSD